jgi:hypothetical protein
LNTKFFDKNGVEIQLNPPGPFCANPACLGEPWCSAWDICNNYKQQEMTEPGYPVQEAAVVTTSPTPEVSPVLVDTGQVVDELLSELASAPIPKGTTSLSNPHPNPPGPNRPFAAMKTDKEGAFQKKHIFHWTLGGMDLLSKSNQSR